MRLSDLWSGIATLIVGLFAIYLYIKQKRDSKKDAALLVLQEIRYAEQKIRDFRACGSYQLSDRLLPTNTWYTNINQFVKDLSESELDLISRFYSQATFIDSLIKHLSDTAVRGINPIFIQAQGQAGPQAQPGSPLGQIQPVLFSPNAQQLLHNASSNTEFIYNSPAIEKINSLSKRRWYKFGL